MSFRNPDPRPIGVFDSGIGGLTVLDALHRHLPGERFVYIGDTARLPYGTKSAETVRRYSCALARALLAFDVKAIVVACNTASAHALAAVQDMAGPLPVVGMVEPAARAALSASPTGRVSVIATQSTIRAGAYERTLSALSPHVSVSSTPCQILVALAEEGWGETEIATLAVRTYLDPVFGSVGVSEAEPRSSAPRPDTLILGCTHFPILERTIAQVVGPDVTLINCGHAAASELVSKLQIEPNPGPVDNSGSQDLFFVTDDPLRFVSGASRFYGRGIDPDQVRMMDLSV